MPAARDGAAADHAAADGRLIAVRALSNLLFVLAGGIAVLAFLVSSFARSMACGYAPNSTGCRAAWPWEMNGDDRWWLFELPLLIVLGLVAGAVLLRRKSR